MTKQIIEDELWKSRFESANLYHKQWSNLFKCDILENYYEGQQWKSQRELGYNPYVINKFFETVQIKIAQFMPVFPKFLVSPRPGNAEWDIEKAGRSTQIKQDTLNTLIQNEGYHFHEEMEMAFKDSFFRFGMMEVGYAADWILNPNAQHPLPEVDTKKQPNNRFKIKNQPEELPVNERIYFKHISARRFRVGGIDHKYLERCGWVGYYEFVRKEDILALKILNREKVESAKGQRMDNEPESNERQITEQSENALKLWHVWDLRARVQLLILDDPCITIYQRGFKRLNLFDYRPDRRLLTEGFYPIPIAYNWLSMQDEVNETREMLRTHRRRFVRKFYVEAGRIEDTEIEKFETGPDGALIKVNPGGFIKPVDNADLGQSLGESVQLSSDDFSRISGVTDEDRGVPDRTTATQANIVNTRGQLRQNSDRDRIVFWFSRIGREALNLCREKFTAGVWAKLSSPEGERFLGAISQQQDTFHWVSTQELDDGYDFRIDVDVTTLSVAAAQEEKQHFIEFLTTLTQFPMIAFSPTLVREAAFRIGYRNEPAIAELQKMALLMELGRMQQLQTAAQPQPAAPPNGPAGQQIAAQMAPPTSEAMRNQMQNQFGVTQ